MPIITVLCLFSLTITNIGLMGWIFHKTEVMFQYLLPSLSERSSTVAYEALIAGLAEVCTPNTGSIVEDGVNGLVVPVLDPKRVAECLMAFIAQPERLVEMSAAASSCSEGVGISAYRQRLLAALETIDL